MKTSVFSTKDVVAMSLLVAVIFTICLFLCSLYVNNNSFSLSQDANTQEPVKTEYVQLME